MKYSIKGTPFPVVICDLEQDEKILCQSGAMSWMSPNMILETTSNGGIGKMFGRFISRESMFQNIYTARGGPGMIAFASRLPGNIKAIEIKPGQSVICQKSSFLASILGVNMSVYLNPGIKIGLFGGEGFVFQKFEGKGLLFVELDGSIMEYNLAAGEQLFLSTGHLAMMDGTCHMSVSKITGAKNILFGGEGLFNTTVLGPGRVFVQTMPIYKLAMEIGSYIPQQINSNNN